MSQINSAGNVDSANTFQIKVIGWSEYEHQTPILLQDLNGPCPLIALVNTLLLNNEIDLRNEAFNPEQGLDQANRKRKFEGINNLKLLLLKDHSSTGTIELSKLLSQLGDVLLVMLEIRRNDFPTYNLDKLLESLPLLHTGLSVNPNLVNGEFPAEDLSTTLFELFDLKLRHGWYIDSSYESTSSVELPENSTASLESIFRELQTFDKIQDFLLYEPQNDIQKSLKIEIQEKQRLMKTWLENNPTQLTDAGMKNLNRTLQTEEFIIFFRNNHFSTLYKKDENDFYTLLTDASFHKNDRSYKKIVWQSFISVSGSDDLFFTGNFLPVLGDEDEPSSQDQDYLYIKKLQEEEDEAMAEKMQQHYNKNEGTRKDLSKRSNQNLNKEENQKSSPTSESNSEVKSKQKKKSMCIIV